MVSKDFHKGFSKRVSPWFSIQRLSSGFFGRPLRQHPNLKASKHPNWEMAPRQDRQD